MHVLIHLGPLIHRQFEPRRGRDVPEALQQSGANVDAADSRNVASSLLPDSSMGHGDARHNTLENMILSMMTSVPKQSVCIFLDMMRIFFMVRQSVAPVVELLDDTTSDQKVRS